MDKPKSKTKKFLLLCLKIIGIFYLLIFISEWVRF